MARGNAKQQKIIRPCLKLHYSGAYSAYWSQATQYLNLH